MDLLLDHAFLSIVGRVRCISKSGSPGVFLFTFLLCPYSECPFIVGFTAQCSPLHVVSAELRATQSVPEPELSPRWQWSRHEDQEGVALGGDTKQESRRAQRDGAVLWEWQHQYCCCARYVQNNVLMIRNVKYYTMQRTLGQKVSAAISWFHLKILAKEGRLLILAGELEGGERGWDRGVVLVF